MWRAKLIIAALLISIFNGCDSQIVNINNTWDLPQQGFNVFYRFFRDKITWYEADAVCQFHHGNLVTVDNILQFDTTRNFLKVLNVTQSVWIGLMRPENSKVFAWPNSMTLANDAGYWAESLPLIDSPLCTVIDPARDYRWHAFRCGGPITASFLCELKIPHWAEACIPKDKPLIDIQYLADNGVLKLSKVCDSGRTFQRMCRTKQDLIKILKELPCKSSEKDLSNTHYKSLELIKNVSSDNNEDNNISTQPKNFDQATKLTTDKNIVHKLTDQFHADEIMHADQPQDYIATESSKVTKKTLKKAKSFKKKNEQNKTKIRKTKPKNLSLEEMMMGDQPQESVEESQEPLPHIKKSFTQDLKHHLSTTESLQISTETTTGNDKEAKIFSSAPDTITFTSVSTIPTTLSVPNTKTGSIGHPMHFQQQSISDTSSIENKSETTEDDTKLTEVTKDASESHFVPPMLLVKSHYVSTKSHLEDQNASSTPIDKATTIMQSVEPSTPSYEPKINSNLENNNLTTTIITISSTLSPSSTVSNNFTHHNFTHPRATQLKFETHSNHNQNQTVSQAATTITEYLTNSAQTMIPMHEENINNNQEKPTENNFEISSSTSTSTENNNNNHDLNENNKTIPKPINKFSNEENFQPYKPNRRRALTKPETTNFLKKILG